ncbi:MAG: AAA family ATPase, partial [Geminicoccaceae bacterium]
MTQLGGPAAINGFLYQILHHIGWIADVALKGEVTGEHLKNACLVLEPRTGGDAQAEGSGVFLVEQYKTRSSGTWSVSNIVESALRDLRKAVPSPRPSSACYRFVTDGRPGRLENFDAFLSALRAVASPCDLDDQEKHRFSHKLNFTHRAFFDHIDLVTRTGSGHAIADDYADVFHLLSHFEMEFGSCGATKAESIERQLKPYAMDPQKIQRVRLQLIGDLMNRLSQGECQLGAADLDEILRHAGLNPERLRRFTMLSETLGRLTDERLSDRGYSHTADVREAPDWPDEKSVLLITGESGVGKTWQLYQLLKTHSDEQLAATIVPVTRRAEDILTRAARDIGQTGLRDSTDRNLAAVANSLREIGGIQGAPQIAIAVDDVQDVDLARDLVRQDWLDWGMRLILTVPESVARSLELTDANCVHAHRVTEFSVDELDRLLKNHGQRWMDLPADLKRLLRRPVLAGFYLSLPYESFQAAPQTEYEIFEGFWQRILISACPGDEGIVIALAGHVLNGNPYPLARPRWSEIGLADESLMRLVAAGWLRSIEGGEIVFSHDRLLNWAAAKSLVNQLRRGQLSIDDLGTFLAGEIEGQDQHLIRRLAYLPMDVFWLLAASRVDAEDIGRLAMRLEESHCFGAYGQDLYV